MTEYEKEWFEEGLLRDSRRHRKRIFQRRQEQVPPSWPVDFIPTPTPETATAEARFKEVSAAYDVIGDDDKRARYDEVRKMGPIGPRFGGGPRPGSRYRPIQRRNGRHR